MGFSILRFGVFTHGKYYFFLFLTGGLPFFGATVGAPTCTAAAGTFLCAGGTKIAAQRFRGRALFSPTLGSGEGFASAPATAVCTTFVAEALGLGSKVEVLLVGPATGRGDTPVEAFAR